jgi:hypothetical protein
MATEMNSVSENLRSALIRDFKTFYSQPDIAGLEGIDRIYTQDIEFRDPAHAIYGRLALKTYLRSLYGSTTDISFEYLDEQIGENSASVMWQMKFSHPRLGGGKPLKVRGMTLIRFTDRIYYHEDFFDLGAMLYQHVPVLGAVVRHLKRRLSP